MATCDSEYLKTLLLYFEEEIMGEAYFYGLVKHFDAPHEREKLALLAEVERFAAESVRPLVDKYELTPRPNSELKAIGESWVARHVDFEWAALMADIAVRYHDYLVDFHALESIAPKEDMEFLNVLTDHEVAAIEFAEMEVAGHPDSLVPIHRYLMPTG